MTTFTPKREEQILQQAINRVVARTSLSDITDASSFKQFLRAQAREMDEGYFQMGGPLRDLFDLKKAQGDDLDERAAEIQPATIARRDAVKATGSVVFSRSGTSGTVVIASGTTIKNADGIAFVTTAAGSILDTAQNSSAVDVIAVVAGTEGNLSAGSLVKFGAKPAGVETVTNPSGTSGGRDRETDDEFRARLLGFIASLAKSTPQALAFVALGVVLETGESVAFSHIYEDPVERGNVTLYIDDGSGTAEDTTTQGAEVITAGLPGDVAVGGEEILYLDNWPVKTSAAYSIVSGTRGTLVEGTDYYLNPANGQLYFAPPLTAGEGISTPGYTYFTGLIAEVQKIVDGDTADAENYPGYRAAGVRVVVLPPTIVQQVVSGSIVSEEGYLQADVVTAAETAIAAYINGLGISGDIVLHELIKVIMEVEGVYDVTLTEPTANVIVLDDELPRITSSNILMS